MWDHFSSQYDQANANYAHQWQRQRQGVFEELNRKFNEQLRNNTLRQLMAQAFILCEQIVQVKAQNPIIINKCDKCTHFHEQNGPCVQFS